MYCVFNFAQKHKSKYHCLPFYLVTLFLIDTLTLVKREGTCVFWNYTLLMSCTLDLSSLITCKKATTSGIFSIGVGYCGVSEQEFKFRAERLHWFCIRKRVHFVYSGTNIFTTSYQTFVRQRITCIALLAADGLYYSPQDISGLMS